MKNPPFFIIGLPRSRTAWLANFLTWGPSFCWHEASRYVAAPCKLPEYLEATGADIIGNSDSCLLATGRGVMDILFPDARYVFVTRPWMEAADSYKKAFPEFNSPRTTGIFYRRADDLKIWMDLIPDERKMVAKFSDLDSYDLLAAIWDFCTLDKLPFDYARAQMLIQMRVDTIFSKMENNMHPVYQEALKKIRTFRSVLP